MVLRYIDGFDHYQQTNGADLLNTGVGQYARYVQAQNLTTGRPPAVTGAGGYSVLLPGGSNQGYLELDTISPQTTTIVGFRCKMDAGSAGSSGSAAPMLFSFQDNGTSVLAGAIGNVSAQQVSVEITTDGVISVYLGGRLNAASGSNPTVTDTLIGRVANKLNPFVWNHMEIKATINGTTGVLAIRVNSQLVISLSGVNTQCTGNAYANGFSFYTDPFGAFNMDLDDFYMCDGTSGTGTYPGNDFLGEMQVLTLVPNGAGSSSGWTPLSGANYTNVDSLINPNGTIYNSTTTTGTIDEYAVTDLPANVAGVAGVQVTGSYIRTGTAAHQIGQRVLSSGTISSGGTYSTTNNYQYFSDPFPVDPATGTTWTVAAVNAVQIGESLVS